MLASESTILSIDFFPGNNNLVGTTLEGEIFIMAVDEDLRTIKHENFDMINMRSNLIFCSKTVKDHPSEAGVFFVGAEDKSMHKFTYDKTDNSLEELI